jgi:hypothetical protein
LASANALTGAPSATVIRGSASFWLTALTFCTLAGSARFTGREVTVASSSGRSASSDTSWTKVFQRAA